MGNGIWRRGVVSGLLMSGFLWGPQALGQTTSPEAPPAAPPSAAPPAVEEAPLAPPPSAAPTASPSAPASAPSVPAAPTSAAPPPASTSPKPVVSPSTDGTTAPLAPGIGASPPANVDRGILALVLSLLEADKVATVVKAAKELAAVGDVRVVGVLYYVAMHDNRVPVARGAVTALAQVDGAEALQGLKQLAVTGYFKGVRNEAIDQLAAKKTPAAGELLYAVATEKTLKQTYRERASKAFKKSYPELAAAKKLTAPAGGAVLPAMGGALFGAYTLGTVGLFAKRGVATFAGVVAGAALGAGTGYMLGRDLSTTQQFYHLSALGWGTFYGMLSSRVLQLNPDDKTTFGLGVVGELAGWGLGIWAEEELAFESGDVWVTNLGGVAAMTLTFGLLDFVDEVSDRRKGFGALMASGMIGMGLSGYATKSLSFSQGDRALSVLGAVEGGYFGFMLTELVHERDNDAGFLVGASVGLLGAGALSQVTEYDGLNVGQMLLASTYGKLLGAGGALLLDPEDAKNPVIATHLITGAIGLGAAAVWGPQLKYERGDFALVPIGTAFGLWQGVAMGLYLDEKKVFNGTQGPGFAMTMTALGGVGAMALAQSTDLTTLEATMGGSGAVWGAWLAGWSAVLLDVREENIILAAALGSDVGLGISVLLESSVVGVDPRVLAAANFGGVAAAGVATLLAAMATEDSDTLMTANIVASGAGLVIGGLVGSAHFKDAPPSPKEIETSSTWGLPLLGVMAQPYVNRRGEMDGMTLNGVFATDGI